MAETYQIHLTRGNKKRALNVICTEEYIRRVINKTFKGRFSKPAALNITDGVKLIVTGMGKVVLGRRIYNKSVFQAFAALDKAIENTPL